MPEGTYYFPEGFLWGAATAAAQVEGRNPNNTWSAWEQEEGRIIEGQRSGLECDWWGGRWREDFDRAQTTFQNAHRLSIAWSRIQPAPDRWDETALDYYREMLIGLKNRGMVPMVTLHHFSEPLWLAEMGGWENPDTIDYFTKFTEKAVEALSPYCSLWVTINEPDVFALSAYLVGLFPPGKKDIKAAYQVLKHMVIAHARAYHVIHEIQPDAQVGSSYHYRQFKPATWFPADRWLANLFNQLFNNLFPQTLVDGNFNAVIKKESIPEAIGTQDFIGLNYYANDLVRFSLKAKDQMFAELSFPKDALLSETGFIAHQPEGMEACVRWGMQFGKPIYITENGVDDSTDELRPRYLVEHLHSLWRVINDNAPVRGYFHWTLVDNFEWERGWTQHFGLWGLEEETQKRIRRPSVDLFTEICRLNGISSEIVEKYAPDAMQRVFPPA
ncbi:MAG: glycoside hydrolase family 1 protein [Anaerolineaceae bacterium]|nr:glycoside hydrolase family 1 protein [Anaerolineaceae bacterium]